ncbi:hypothetical protein DIS24_g9971 [Lasiodiplodia hormozganensis]|uniref:Uncharacterized protein n=1 Tax=Lasiodiplodia hormozganensis TaxID=869390 RepID=A0AA39XR70_9PEZI|nr:hypothetical protein DIS24_g9971 [Lasiodiplodia hormozganensis]
MANLDHTDLPLRVSFIKSEAHHIHQALSVPSDYDRLTDTFVPPRQFSIPDGQLQVEREDLQAVIAEFQSSFPNSDLELDAQNCSWDDVFKQLESAQVRHEAMENDGGIGYLRKLWRKAGENANRIDPWLDFIPDEKGLNIVRAGLVVILQLAKRAAEERERVQKAVVVVVDVVTGASPKRRIFRWDDSLKNCIHKLYASVLEAVAVIIQYLLQRVEKPRFPDKAIKKARGLFKDKDEKPAKPKPPTKSVKHVDNAVESVQLKSEEFSELCINLRDEIFVATYMQGLESRESLRRIDAYTKYSAITGIQIQKTVGRNLPAIKETVNDYLPVIKAQNKVTHDKLDDVKKAIEAESDARYAKLENLMKEEIGRCAQNLFNEFLKSHEKTLDQGPERPGARRLALSAPEIPRSRTPVPGPAPLASLEMLIELLGIPISAPNDDLDIILMEKEWFKEQTLSMTEILFQTPHFGEWFFSDSSGLLLADGNDEEHANSTISAMSVVCLSLIGSIVSARRDNQVILHFFCSLHRGDREGPCLMMRSLIMQLLFALRTRHYLDLGFIPNDTCLQDLQQGEFQALLFIFKGLIRQFPAHMTVYCVIDGVQSFENYPLHFQSDMLGYVKELRMLAWPLRSNGWHSHLTGDYKSYGTARCKFKVLLTSANGTELIGQQITSPSRHVALGYDF